MAPEASSINSAHVANPQSPHFVGMVSSIPVVASALDVAKFYYDATKSRYELVGRIEKELVENVVPHVVTTATKATPQSAQALISSSLTHLDQYACSTLDLLEKNVPLIMEPTPKIIETGKNLVNERIITPVDQLVEKALGYSEDKVNSLLPTAEKQEKEEEEEDAPPAAKKQKIARAQKLGAEVSKRLSERATAQYEVLKKVATNTPQELQKLVSSDAVRLVSANVEKQLAWLKENVDLVLARLQKEDGHIRKLLEGYSAELKASFTLAIERLEKVTPATVKETSHVVFQGLSKSIGDFAENFKRLTADLSVSPSAKSDPYVQLFLDTANSTIAYFQTYAQSLSHFIAFQKPAASTTPATESQ